MAKTKEKKQPTGTQKPEKAFNIKQIADTFRTDTFKFVLGAILMVVALFLIGAYISFLFNGGADQSVLTSSEQNAVNSTGSLGAAAANLIVNRWFGFSSILIPIFMIILGSNLMGLTHFKIWKWFIICIFLTLWLSIFLNLVLRDLTGIMSSSFIMPGGNHGMNATDWLNHYIGIPGIFLLLFLTMLLFCVFLTRKTIEWVRNRADNLKKGFRRPAHQDEEEETLDVDNEGDEVKESHDSFFKSESYTPTVEPVDEIPEEPLPDEHEPDSTPIRQKTEKAKESTTVEEEKEVTMTINTGETVQKAEGNLQEPYDPRLDLSHYRFPTLDLLKHYDNETPAIDEREQIANKNRIIEVLRNFGIEIDSINATVGPTITLYEITPAPGVRISKIRNLEADIALSLSALGIRIIAPIPGKGTIGIEVPNAKPVMVSMESIINSRKFAESKMELPVALGRTITNDVFMFDLAKMPHLLVAGATGQGKSVGLNAVITSLLYKKHPAELKLVMVDPKMVEFSIYSPIVKHFLAKMPDETDAIITDTTKVIHTLKSLCIEMDSRYELLKDANVRSVIEYNNKFKDRQLNPEKGHRYLPYIVVVIDEFGDLIMTAGKDIEMPIARIAQKARAVGMHMIIATQRPTTNIITGTIKANFPARMAFRVSSMIDSRTILDRPGANQLIGRGDLLFLSGSDPVRVQCAFVDTPEVNNICQYISRQQGYTEAYPLPEYTDENESGGSSEGGMDIDKFDPMFAEAARLIVVQQSGSTSLIQRKFAIGYNRAGRLMDQLERAGIVGRADGSKPRPVLVADEVQLDRILESLNLL